MIEFRRILCPIDFSGHSRHALDCAVAMARWYGSRLTALHVYTAWPADGIVPPSRLDRALYSTGAGVEVERDDLERQLHAFVQPSAGGLEIDVVLQEAGDVPREILAQANMAAADLIVVASHGRSGFERLLLGSITEKILRKAACPVMVVPPRAAHIDPAAAVQFKQILCPVDFSPGSTAALRYTFSLAEEADARLTIFHALEIPPELEPSDDARHVNVDAMRARAEAERLRALRELVPDAVREYCTVETVVAEGRAAREVLKLATARGSDLIVMGVQGRGAVDLLMFGSNTREVVRGAPCPVLTIRTRERSEQVR